MSGAKREKVDALDSIIAPASGGTPAPSNEVALPQIVPYEHGVRVNCSEAISQRVASKLAEELLKAKGEIVLDFRGKCTVGLPVLGIFAHMAKAHAKNQYGVYLLRPDEELTKLVQSQGLEKILQLAGKNSMVPGLKDDPVPKLDLKFINSFIDSTIDTLKTQCNVELKALKPFLSTTRPTVKGDIIGLITIKSENFNGVIAISLPEQIFLFAMSMMVGETFTEITDDVASGATELLNIIYGNAKMTLNQQGYKLQKVIPSVIRGQGMSLTHITSSPTLIIPFETEKGIFHIEIGLTEVHAD